MIVLVFFPNLSLNVLINKVLSQRKECNRIRTTYLEVPKEVIGDFEVRTDSEDFVDEILNANDSKLACGQLREGEQQDREQMGWKHKGRKQKGREQKGREQKGREQKGREQKGREQKRRKQKGRKPKGRVQTEKKGGDGEARGRARDIAYADAHVLHNR